MASITMMPSEVVMAHTEYSLCPKKYMLSNAFTGSAYQVDLSGVPRCPPPVRAVRRLAVPGARRPRAA